MLFSKLSILAIGAPLASAIGNARVVNNCPHTVTSWSVGSQISDAHTLKSHSSYSEPFTRDAKTGGRTIKITKESDGLFTGKPQANFAYNLKDGRIWYDLSDVFGDPFKGKKLVVSSSDGKCPSIEWKDGVPPSGSQVKNCGAGSDVTFTLCA